MSNKKQTKSPKQLLTLLKKEAVKKGIFSFNDWKGKCSTLAHMMLDNHLVVGRFAYGHWIGAIHPKSSFSNRRHLGFCNHAWILQSNGTIVDPTRWVFENIIPYIYVGKNDFYDEGGSKLRDSLHREPPTFNNKYKNYQFTVKEVSNKVWSFIKNLLKSQSAGSFKPRTIDEAQLFWLANCSPDFLFPFAEEIYKAIVQKGRIALIPIDYQRMMNL